MPAFRPAFAPVLLRWGSLLSTQAGGLVVVLIMVFGGFTDLDTVLVVLVPRNLAGSAFAFGVVLGLGAIGAVGGSLAGARVANRLGRRTTLAGAVALQGLALGAMAVTTAVWQLAAISLLAGFPAGVQRPVARGLQQRLTPNQLLGRVNIAARVFTRGVIIIGALASGAVAATAGVRWSFVVGGAIQVVAAFLMWRALTDREPSLD